MSCNNVPFPFLAPFFFGRISIAVKHTVCMFKLHWNRAAEPEKKGRNHRAQKAFHNFLFQLAKTHTHNTSVKWGLWPLPFVGLCLVGFFYGPHEFQLWPLHPQKQTGEIKSQSTHTHTHMGHNLAKKPNIKMHLLTSNLLGMADICLSQPWNQFSRLKKGWIFD